MDTLYIGQIITCGQTQDAVHMAIAPVVAYRTLRPGEHVALNDDGEADIFGKCIGIVDPFLSAAVKKGEKFWLFLYPGSITSLKHFWTHPAFENKPQAVPVAPIQTTVKELPVLDSMYSRSLKAITAIADNYDLDAESLLEAADNYVTHNEYFSQGERFEGEYLTDDFWPHYEVVRDVKVPANKRYSFFSCSC